MPASDEGLGRIQALATAERALQSAIASPLQDRIAADVAAALGSPQAAQPKPKFCPTSGHRNAGSVRVGVDRGARFAG
ncbi:hypothetical protein [uncultured Azohydromonas sp.]|uniref:hypothetical protein n=1 Tax=uncultured Azohydromonas sp. TaxID=487342 RepID=UPI00261C6478|nr:hypothetical protein [uncultured Azohydromonas sp.]